jgi:hypothetical protein
MRMARRPRRSICVRSSARLVVKMLTWRETAAMLSTSTQPLLQHILQTGGAKFQDPKLDFGQKFTTSTTCAEFGTLDRSRRSHERSQA